MIITNLTGKLIYNSQGSYALQCSLTLNNNKIITASCPKGTSLSKYEPPTQSDSDALYHIKTTIQKALKGHIPHLPSCDIILQDLAQHYGLGIQTVLPVSIAIAKAHAYYKQYELFSLLQKYLFFHKTSMPQLFFYMLHGGCHAKNKLYIQEILVTPLCNTLHESLAAGQKIQQTLINLFEKKELATNRTNILCCHQPKPGKPLSCEKEALDLICQAIEMAGFKPGIDVELGLDVAASQFYNEQKKLYFFQNNFVSATEMISYYKQLCKNYPITFIEDGLGQDDEQGWKNLCQALYNVHIVGDDLFASNTERIKRGIAKGLANGAIIRPGQTLTVSQLLDAIKTCHDANFTLVTSPRTKETPDIFVADLTIASNAKFYKTIACHSPYHMKKNYRLCAIEKLLLKQKTNFRMNASNGI